MKKNKIGYYIFSTLLLTSIIIFRNKYAYISFWTIMTLGLIFKLGFPRDKNYYKGNVIRICIIFLFTYFIGIYSLGFITGFAKSFFKLSFFKILSNILEPLIFIVSTELIRFIYAKNSHSDKKPLIYLTIVYILIDIIMEFNFSYFDNFELLFIFACLTVLPSIANESLYSYVSYNAGYVPNLIMRLCIGLYIYILPIFPNLGNYINSVLGVLCPVIVYMSVSRIIKLYDKNDKYVVAVKRRYLFIPLLLLTAILIVLVSGIGKYKIVAIASGSMEPEFYRGDAIVFQKIEDVSKIEIGNIIAYKKNGVLVTHRVVGMSRVKGSYVFLTKGDNNDSVDSYEIFEEDIEGIVIYKVSYIGMPTIWLQELFDNL